jgi:RNA polymerase sigma-70 factor (ECF subfamily)
MSDFETLRPLLFGIAYRMLGSAMEAEDVVQETYLRYRAVPEDTVRSPKAFLTKIVTRLCLDQLKAARTQREVYIGPWLPEPILTSDPSFERAIEAETLSMAFLLLLEHLSPPERAVFLLHEVFDYNYQEIGDVVGKTEAACRQILHRAKAHLADQRSRLSDPVEVGQAVLGEFIRAVSSGDVAGLMQLISADGVALTDGGGKVSAATRALVGADRIARSVFGFARLVPPNAEYEVASINAQPGIIIRVGGQIFMVIVLHVSNGQIQNVYFVRNPDKLRLLSMPR